MSAQGFEIPSPRLSRPERRAQKHREALIAYLKESVATVEVEGVHRAFVAARTVLDFEPPKTDSIGVITVGDTDIPYHIPDRSNAEYDLVSGLSEPETKVYKRLTRDGRRRLVGTQGVVSAYDTYEASLGLSLSAETATTESVVSA